MIAPAAGSGCLCGAFVSGPVITRDAALFTDLYELTMAASYLRERMQGEATFSLFVRHLPAHRSFLVAAGLEDVLAFLESFEFSEAAVRYLRALGMFDAGFLDFLGDVRFTGTVWAMREGTVLVADEPLLEVTAPIVEAQLVETAIINFVHLQTVLASKAVRSVLAARGRAIVDFGLRRTHGIDAGMKAARCAFIAGATATSNVLAGFYEGIPPAGTMAHSYVMAFPGELEAFRAFARTFPRGTTLLLDTYDTVAAAHKAVIVGRELEQQGARLAGVRLDSGELVQLSREVRRILDDAGLPYVRIFASGGLDEEEVARCLDAGAPIDAFGVGTRMNVSADAPYLDIAYKLVRYGARDVLKLSPGKATWPGEKQVYRLRGSDGRFERDVLTRRDEPAPDGSAEPLLRAVMAGGRRLDPAPTLAAIRERCAQQVAALPETLRRLATDDRYVVEPSARLMALRSALEAQAMGAGILRDASLLRHPGRTAMTQAMSKTDTQIHHDVLEELKWDSRVDETEVGVEVDNGVVTLTGTVTSWAKRMAAEEAAHRVSGVLDVANDVKVRIPGELTRTDTEIAQAVRRTLEWDVFVPDERITSTVSDGWVTLDGTVERWSECDDTERAVRNLTGVKGVANRITVEPARPVTGDVRKAIERALERRAERVAGRIRVEVRGGIVTLTGSVHSRAERESVVAAARFAPGVRDVEDHLQTESAGERGSEAP
ncbi:MAG TPA: nicotinate phosphoribosyltransferase [Methylomirabilota bacterium]